MCVDAKALIPIEWEKQFTKENTLYLEVVRVSRFVRTLNINWNPIGFCRYIWKSRQNYWLNIKFKNFTLAENLEFYLSLVVGCQHERETPFTHRINVKFYFRF